jgi:outer membrane protein OmpA-like peptidoglycan-associated protein
MEKKIKSYKEFLDNSKMNEEEDLKNWAVGTAMAASTLNPFSKALASDSPTVDKSKTSIETSVQNKEKEDDGKTFHWGKEKTKSHTSVKTGTEAARKKQADYLVGQGWTLDSTSVDTLWREVQIQAPDTIVTEHNFKFDVEGDQFLTGKFQLNQTVVDGVNEAIEQVQSEGGIVTDFQIESSTDKEPIVMEYEGMSGNEALAHRRADVVEDELVKIGVDDSIISIVTKPEQGPDVYKKDMSKEERTEARKQSAASRYVTISIIYVTKDVVSLPSIKESIPKLKTIYYLSKETEKMKRPPKMRHAKHKKAYSPIKNTHRKNSRLECETFGNKDAWWFHL